MHAAIPSSNSLSYTGNTSLDAQHAGKKMFRNTSQQHGAHHTIPHDTTPVFMHLLTCLVPTGVLPSKRA